jgi:hypothetical protein
MSGHRRSISGDIRTLGQIVHPTMDAEALLARLSKLSPEEQMKILANGSSLIGLLAKDDETYARIAAIRDANLAICANPEIEGLTGRELGLGYQPQLSFYDLLDAVFMNSNVLKREHIRQAREVTAHGGATAFVIFQPRLDKQGRANAGHVELVFSSNDKRDGEDWFITALNDPKGPSSDNAAVRERLSSLGLSTTRPSEPITDFEKLFSSGPPDSRLGAYGILLARPLAEGGTTFAELAAAQRGTPDAVVYQTSIVAEIRISPDQYAQALRLRELMNISQTLLGSVASLGAHFGINSYGHLVAALLDQTGTMRGKPLSEIVTDMIDRATHVHITRENGKRLSDFFGDNGPDADFYETTTEDAIAFANSFFVQPTMRTSIDPEKRAAYDEQYNNFAMPHPDPARREIYSIAADLIKWYLENHKYNSNSSS